MSATLCRDDGRCQYAIDNGADVLASCPVGQCCHPQLKPCPFCGGAVKLEHAGQTESIQFGRRNWWGVVCRNTINHGGTCCMEQVPSASMDAAIARWNMRDGKP